ncbi:hypothetical protein [Natrinema sp. 74]|uniref:hypothetical protein n=1 Tax=Natrinema sp. 74 TaxID=3384159 RepID=UPI0038D38235
MTPPSSTHRRFLLSLSAAGASAVAGCLDRNGATQGDDYQSVPSRDPVDAPADVSTALTAVPATVQPGADASAENWLYNGEFPGPESG